MSTKFFRRISQKNQGEAEVDRFYYAQGRICQCKTLQDFQAIWDICYFHKMSPANRFKKRLQVTFTDMCSMLRKQDKYRYLGRDRFQSSNSWDNELSKYIKEYEEWLASNEQWLASTRDPLSRLCAAVLLEMCFVCKLQMPEQMPEQMPKQMPKQVQTTWQVWSQALNGKLKEYRTKNDKVQSYYDYYKNGIKEVKRLCDILKNIPPTQNSLPTYDLGHTNKIFIDPDTSEYSQFCEEVDKFARAESSIVLKYIVISGLTYSSGERALQNLLSWLMIPPNYKECFSGENTPLRDNVLLMIDELDLYMHPEWQRQSMMELLERLKTQYCEKNIQLLIATHSPLVLSDIPAENCIFLDGGKEHLTFAKGAPMEQTFGANVHNLLKRSFFLENTMGAFAYERIKEMAENLEELKDLKRLVQKGNTNGQGSIEEREGNTDEQNRLRDLMEQCREYLDVIKHIGEPLIRDKLLALYDKCYAVEKELQDELVDRLQQLPEDMSDTQKERLCKKLRDTLGRLEKS